MEDNKLLLLQTNPLTDWTKEPDVAVLKGDFTAAKTAHDAQMRKIKKWQDLYAVTGSAKPNVEKGSNRSSVQPKLVRRQAEWRYPALSEPFLGSDKLFKVSPTTFEDAEGARQNELVLNWQFRTKLNRVKFIDDYVRATVDEGTCIVRLGWDRVTKTVTKDVPVWAHYEITSEDQMMQLQQALQLQQADPRGYEESVPPAVKEAINLYHENGLLTYAEQSGVESVETEVVFENRPTVEVLNPENVYIDPSCGGDFSKALFVVVSFETNRAELQKKGDRYKNLDKVNWEGASPITDSDHASSTPSDFNFSDALRKKVVAYEYWGYYDINGTNELTPIVATWIGDTMIRLEENPFPDAKLPFVLVPYSPVKREIYGEPDAEILEDNQRILGAVTRGMIDLMGRSANSQQGFAKGMLDPVNRRRFERGQDYEFNPTIHPQNGMITHTYPEIPNSAMAMLSLQNQDAESLTGVKAFSGGLSGEAYGDVAAGVRGMMDAAAKREMAILRRLARGMVEIGQKIIAMNAVFLSDTEVVRVTNNEFVSVNRDDLAGNYDLIVDISTAEVDNSKAQDLGFMLQTLGPNMDETISMSILAEIAELKRMPTLAQKLRTWQPQPNPAQEQKMQLEIQKLQLELAELQSKIQVNQAKAKELGATADAKNLDFLEQETGTKHAREMEKQKAQSEGNQQLAITRALTQPLRPDQLPPDVPAAIGYNKLSQMES